MKKYYEEETDFCDGCGDLIPLGAHTCEDCYMDLATPDEESEEEELDACEA